MAQPRALRGWRSGPAPSTMHTMSLADRQAVLARRAQFIAAALVGVGCATPPPPPKPASLTIAEPEPLVQPTPEAESTAAPAAPPERVAAPDRDGDGVPDDEDACPDQPGPPDPADERRGCPRAVPLACLWLDLDV